MPQGGPLSPLLSNVMLNELDKELERRGHRFVRYADDCMIFCKSRKSAERTLSNILQFIEEKLFLKVNRKKTYQQSEISGIYFLQTSRKMQISSTPEVSWENEGKNQRNN